MRKWSLKRNRRNIYDMFSESVFDYHKSTTRSVPHTSLHKSSYTVTIRPTADCPSKMIWSTVFSFRLLRFFVITSRVLEHRRSLGTDVAGMHNNCRAASATTEFQIWDVSVPTSEADAACGRSVAQPDNAPTCSHTCAVELVEWLN